MADAWGKKKKKEKNLLNLQAHPEECSALFFTGRRKRATSGARKNLARAINSRRSCPLRGTHQEDNRAERMSERKNEAKKRDEEIYIYVYEERRRKSHDEFTSRLVKATASDALGPITLPHP